MKVLTPGFCPMISSEKADKGHGSMRLTKISRRALVWVLPQPPPIQPINNPIAHSVVQSPDNKVSRLDCLLIPL